jgi:hypothetical protein
LWQKRRVEVGLRSARSNTAARLKTSPQRFERNNSHAIAAAPTGDAQRKAFAEIDEH